MALIFLVAMDYKVVEYLRHGPDLIYLDKDGRMLPTPPLSFVDCAALGVLIALQVLLIIGLYRLRRRKSRV